MSKPIYVIPNIVISLIWAYIVWYVMAAIETLIRAKDNAEYLAKNGFIVIVKYKGIKIIKKKIIDENGFSHKYGLFFDRYVLIEPTMMKL